VYDGHAEVVERVAGQRLDMAGEARAWRHVGGPWRALDGRRRLAACTAVMVEYRRQHELGHASRHAPVNHVTILPQRRYFASFKGRSHFALLTHPGARAYSVNDVITHAGASR